MEEMSVKMMEDEKLENITEVEEAGRDGSASTLVAGVIGGFLAYTMIDGVRRLWGFVGAKLAERKTAEKAKAEVVDTEYTGVTAEDSDEEDSEK